MGSRLRGNDVVMGVVMDTVSPWIARFAPLVPAGEVLDLACGSGRHARLFASLGHPVLAVDRDPAALAAVGWAGSPPTRPGGAGNAGNAGNAGSAGSAGIAGNAALQPVAERVGGRPAHPTGVPADITPMLYDLEADGNPWPFAPGRFAGIVVTNYLHRPLMAHLLASLAPNGVLVYETFAVGNEQYGKPSNPAFLLQPGELLAHAATAGLRVIAYEHGLVNRPKPALVQRLCAAGPAYGWSSAVLDHLSGQE